MSLSASHMEGAVFMATVMAMARMNYMMYQLGTGGFGSSLYSRQASTSSSGSLSSYLRSAGLTKEFSDASKKFDSEFGEKMDALAKSSDALKKVNFGAIGQNDITTTEGEDGASVTTKSSALTDAVGAVKDFVKDYNSAIGFFRDNSNDSAEMRSMAENFADTRYYTKSLEKVGISVDSSGKMTVDEDKLTTALTEDSSGVKQILGQGGLASRADTHIASAKARQGSLFSSIFTGSVPSTSTYGFSTSFGGYNFTGNNLSRMLSYSMTSSFLNLYA